MKTKASSCVPILLLFVALAARESPASEKRETTADAAVKALEGTWVNTESSETDALHPRKLVITPDCRLECWTSEDQDYPDSTGKFSVAKSWFDSKGNMYCRIDTKWPQDLKYQELWRIDMTGNTLEVNYRMAGSGYPKRTDPAPHAKAPQYEYYFIVFRR